MIILVGISVNLTIGNNGLITKAKQAKKDIEEATLNEQAAMNELYDEMMIATGSTSDDISTDGIPDIIIEYIDKKLNSKMLDIYPVGSIYISTESTNPSELFGGTWESYGEGRTLVGEGSGYEAGTTGGSSTTTLTVENLPSHYHRYTPNGTISSTFSNGTAQSAGAHSHSIPQLSGATNSGGAHNHIIAARNNSYGNLDNINSVVATGHAEYDSSTGQFTRASGDHSHTIYTNASTTGSAGAHTHTVTGTVSSTFSGTTSNTESTGSGTPFSVQDPYITVYMWKRIE